MKHPALARVMAAVFAIMCVIMLVAGIFAIGDAKVQLTADEKEYNKLTERIATYEELTAKLAGVEPSKTAREKLDARQEQHDKDASEYRMDLAERGATQGGYKMGADKLWEAKAELKEGEYQYQVGRAQFEQKAAEFEAMKEQGQQMIDKARSAAAAISAYAPPKPTAPPVPTVVEDPGVFEAPENATPEEIEQARADYDAKLSAYQNYLVELDNYEKIALPEYEQNLESYYNTSAMILAPFGAELAELGLAGVNDCAVVAQTLNNLADSTQLKLTQGEAALNEARAKLDKAGEKIESGKQTIQGNLEQIWYEMGQADEEESEFAARREALMAEAEELAAETAELEQRKQDENKLSSTRLLLKKYAGISERLDNGDELAESAKAYAEQFSADYHRSYKLRLLLCALEIVGGVVGLFCIPAAYEKSKSRALLLIPAVVALLCAAAVEAIGVASGLGKAYAAVPAIIFALLYILAAAPKMRKIESA